MSVDSNVIVEAERLYKKFGNLAVEVARELRNIDAPTEDYFWTCVMDYLNNHSA